LGQALEGEGKHQDAASELQTSLRLQDSAEAHISLARVYISLNQKDLAHDQGEAALRLDPQNQQAQQLLHQLTTEDPAQRTTP
jgi:uncharacterized protein HemY